MALDYLSMQKRWFATVWEHPISFCGILFSQDENNIPHLKICFVSEGQWRLCISDAGDVFSFLTQITAECLPWAQHPRIYDLTQNPFERVECQPITALHIDREISGLILGNRSRAIERLFKLSHLLKLPYQCSLLRVQAPCHHVCVGAMTFPSCIFQDVDTHTPSTSICPVKLLSNTYFSF